MKIQELAIIFIIIILPISILLAEYTQFQIQTLNTQTLYDSKLTSATYDAIKAFQMNAQNETYSDLTNTKLDAIEASIKTFRDSIQISFELAGYTKEELDNYIPALVYTVYDGFYIYSPYENTHDETGNRITGEIDAIYGLKPYISYSCRYKDLDSNIDVVITYALDNYVKVQGIMPDPDRSNQVVYVNKSGYLIDNINVSGENVTYNGISIKTEQLKEEIIINGVTEYCNYAKIDGTKYYLVEQYKEQSDGTYKDCILYFSNGIIIEQWVEGQGDYYKYEDIIKENNAARQYYKEAYNFTDWFNRSDLIKLEYADAYDQVIEEDGSIDYQQIWPTNHKKIFSDSRNNIESELSNFNQHRLAVIRYKIETNLAIAIANYNAYSGVDNVFQLPEIKEDEWEQITHNICLISFLQGLPIGGKIYNGYAFVTNSESEEVIVEENIYILGSDNYYHKVNDIGFQNGTINVDAGNYEGSDDGSGRKISAGRINLDFERAKAADNGVTRYYYPLNDYNASYDSLVMQDNIETYDDIYNYVNERDYDLKIAFYTALGRERFSMFRGKDDINKFLDETIPEEPAEETPEESTPILPGPLPITPIVPGLPGGGGGIEIPVQPPVQEEIM